MFTATMRRDGIGGGGGFGDSGGGLRCLQVSPLSWRGEGKRKRKGREAERMLRLGRCNSGGLECSGRCFRCVVGPGHLLFVCFCCSVVLKFSGFVVRFCLLFFGTL